MSNVNEEARRAYEAAWQSSPSPDIADYLPHARSCSYLATLEELVCIDMELRWVRSVAAPHSSTLCQHGDVDIKTLRLEEYVGRSPDLARTTVLHRLVRQEVECRVQAADKPCRTEYGRRFPHVGLATNTFGSVHLMPTQGKSSTANWRRTQRACPTRIANYRLLHLLGQGGMARVFQAQHEPSGDMFALKVTDIDSVDATMRPEIMGRFSAEVSAGRAISHDNIMPVYDAGESDSLMYYAMPLASCNLSEEVRTKPLSCEVAALYLLQAARGVEAFHDLGMLHRDVKPQNLMLRRDRNQVLVSDFGLARLAANSTPIRSVYTNAANNSPLHSWSLPTKVSPSAATNIGQLTQAGDIIGTLPYMAPEQIRNIHTADERADVYSLGATLYHLLAGRPPFVALTPIETMRQVCDDPPIPLGNINEGVDKDLALICSQCLEKDPSHRTPSATQLASDLERYLRGEPYRSPNLCTT